MEALVKRAVDAIIRPPRKIYSQFDIPQKLQGDDDTVFIRHSLAYINERNIPIVGSYYHGVNMDPTGGGPCVVYLHGNASSQLEGQFLVPNLCKYGIYVVCFDFAGCGCSGGDYVSLGFFEKQDTEFFLDQIHNQFHLGPFILWGRSMGAATALLVDYPLLLARISDSAFTSVPDMCGAIATSMHLPSFFVPAVVWFLKQKVIQAANFDIEAVSPITVTNQLEIPAVFGHAEKDQFIPFEQCRRLYNHYPCAMKYLMVLEGGHNSRREKDWIQLGVSFILDNFKIEVKNLEISTCRRLQQSVFHFASFSSMIAEEGKSEPNRAANDQSNQELMDQFMKEQHIDPNAAEEQPKKHKKHKKHHHHHKKHKKQTEEKQQNEDEDQEEKETEEKYLDSD